jgi:hypothetical protein
VQQAMRGIQRTPSSTQIVQRECACGGTLPDASYPEQMSQPRVDRQLHR